MRYSTIQQVLWDWNGTLLNDVDFCVAMLNELCRRREMEEVSRDAYREMFTFPVIEYYKAMGFDTTPGAFEQVAREWIALYNEGLIKHAALHQGARESLERIEACGIRQSILSAHHRDLLVEATDQFRVSEYFEAILGIDSYHGESKIDLGKAWIADSGVRPASVLMVGDTLHDYEVAQAMGVQCLLVARGHQARHRLETVDIPVLDSIVEVPELLERAHSSSSKTH